MFYNDGFSNLINSLTGMGVPPDSLINVGVNSPVIYSRDYLDNCYRSLWPCRRLVDYEPLMMSRTFGKIVNIEPEIQHKIRHWIRRLRRLYQNGQRMANKDGGAVIIRLIDDGQSPEYPVAYEKIKKIDYSRILDRWEISPDSKSLDRDPIDPEYYLYHKQINDNIYNESIQNNQKIHKSRVLRFRGNFISPQQQRMNNGWEDSLLVPFLDPMLRYLEAQGYVAASVRTFEIMIHKIQDLFTMMQSPEQEAEILKRLRLNQQQMSVLRGVAIAKDSEEMEIITRQFTGVSDILDRLRDEMVAASGLTKVQFLQEHPNGMQATGESERLQEADRIEALQAEKWGENIDVDVRNVLASLGLGTEAIDAAYWEWNSLFKLSPTEESQNLLNLAKCDQLNINSGVYSAEEARHLRYATESPPGQIIIKE